MRDRAIPHMRYDGIQALRLLAALLVVVTHSTFYAAERLSPEAPVWTQGAIGVDIFFAISGFVMVASTAGTGQDWKTFSARRLIRIVPMYWIATTVKILAMIAVPAAVLHAQLDPTKVALSYLFLPTRNADNDVAPTLGVGWTLIFEMAFYLLFAVALRFGIRPLRLCTIVLTALALGSVLRPSGDAWWPGLFYLDSIVLFFLVGMVIAEWSADRRAELLARRLAYVIGLWFLVDVAANGFRESAVEQFGWRVAVVALVLGVVTLEPVLHGRVPRTLLYLGAASYSLYLFHPMIAPAAPQALSFLGVNSAPLSTVLSIALSLVAAAAIYRWVEKPITGRLTAATRRRDRVLVTPTSSPMRSSHLPT